MSRQDSGVHGWDSGVVVSLPGAFTAGLAADLARSTGREHLIVPDIEAALRINASTTTFVATAATVNDHWLAAASGRDRFGLLTARDTDRLTALVSRTLRAHEQRRTASVHVEAMADSVSRAELRSSLAPAATLVLRAHGRECLIHLSDGVICGRSEAPPVVQPDGRRMLGLTSCVQGEGCYRLHYDPEQMMPAAAMGAGIVMLDSCMVQKVGSSQFTSDTTLALSILEGETYAVVASPWIRGGYRAAGPLFTALLRDGMSLGGAVAAVNDEIGANVRAIGRLVLLGDAALRPFPVARLGTADPRTSVSIADNAAWLAPLGAGQLLEVDGQADVVRLLDGRTLALSQGGPVQVKVAGPGESPLERFRCLTDRTQAVARLWAYGLAEPSCDPTEARAALSAAYQELAETLVSKAASACIERAEKSLCDADRAVAARLTALTASSRFHFVDSYSDDCERIEEQPARCPECYGQAVLIKWRHVLDSGIQRLMLSCPVCGEVTDEDSEATVTCRLVGPQHTARTADLVQQAVLTNRSHRTVVAHLGYALLYEELYGTEWAQTRQVTLAPGEIWTAEVGGHVPADFDVADRHGLRLFVAADGRISTYSRYLWVTVSPSILNSRYATR
ncbi:hypothetical protein Q0Z83_053990 [Actinoplanes sichuanensis]|uniref:Uncharacterized protein n=1 Tax=Actinoplanes sichuanensis TaxID=512349 RepID=A0ABW4AS68_9ACTN|nr:hypothetical protein [Actinoplanes sichuanensis]BEL07208.1 hypothetical protein Q0Z83_053990 [Actinoplanes sichuanensis]